jgi:hypothetical protein
VHEAVFRVIVESTNEVRFFLPGLISFDQPVGSLQDGLASKILEDVTLGREGNDVQVSPARQVKQADRRELWPRNSPASATPTGTSSPQLKLGK